MEDSVDHYTIVATTRHRNVCPMLLHAVHCILFLLATIGRKSGDSFVYCFLSHCMLIITVCLQLIFCNQFLHNFQPQSVNPLAGHWSGSAELS